MQVAGNEDIQIVINIPKSTYTHLCNGKSIGASLLIENAIKNGTPLPKGYGDLIDKSKIYKAIPAEEDNCTGMGMTYDEMCAYNDGIDAMYNLVQNAKPIIEADKEKEESEEQIWRT